MKTPYSATCRTNFASEQRLLQRWSRRILLILLILGSISAVTILIGCGSSRHLSPSLRPSPSQLSAGRLYMELWFGG